MNGYFTLGLNLTKIKKKDYVLIIVTSILLHGIVEAQSDVQPNREILATPWVGTDQEKEHVLAEYSLFTSARADLRQRAHKDCKNKHGADKATI